jgi:hypothetical protein
MIVEPRIRLFPNPDFDEKAKAKWDPKAFYEDHEYRSNPELVRPLRAGVSCAICHVAAHPLNRPPIRPSPNGKIFRPLLYQISCLAIRAAIEHHLYEQLGLPAPPKIFEHFTRGELEGS